MNRQTIARKNRNKARTNGIAIEVNALITQEEQEDKCTHHVPLMDLKTQEIALKLKANCRLIKAILDKGSPMTLISRGVNAVMDRCSVNAVKFEEGANSVSSSIRKSKLKLFSCKRDQAVETSGECDVKLDVISSTTISSALNRYS